MTTQMSESEARIERQQVEWVFGLTGGELDSKPLVCADDDGAEHTYAYHYDGVPEYAASDYDDVHSDNADYFTVVTDCLYGNPPDVLITSDGKRYAQVNAYMSSGETECPGMGDGNGKVSDGYTGPNGGKVCVLCEADIGDDHGYIYIGDGWCEVVYRHDAIQAMRDVAAAHNLQVWSDDAVTWECNGTCNDEVTAPLAAVNANNGCCPTCGEAFTGGKIVPARWWWQTCAPGCLPDSDVMGPFDDETEALEDATDGLTD
jgi:hypothetical protein